jgi:DNA-binding transcriptional MocR family regulator
MCRENRPWTVPPEISGTCICSARPAHRYSCRLVPLPPELLPELEPPDARSEGFLYRRLAAALRSQIDRGVLRVGDRLPSVRTVRRLHNVSAATAAGAYIVLEREGYVEARERSGFYVARPATTEIPATLEPSYMPGRVDVGELISAVLGSADERLIPLGLSSLGPELLPTAQLNRAVRRAMAREPLHSASYGDVRGVPDLRRQLARLLIHSGVTCSMEDLIVTAGGLEALNLALRTVTTPGDIIAVESPTYFGVLQAIEALGLRAVEVPSHPRSGVDLALLERAIRRHRAKAAIVMTTCHNPLGCVMTDSAKQELVTLVTRMGVALIEDDVYGELAHGDTRPRPAKAFDRRGHVMLCSSVSKSLAPGLRVGWIVPGKYQRRTELVKSVTSRITSALPQLGLAGLLETGFYPRYIRRLRQQVAGQVARYAAAVEHVFPDGTRMTRPAGGTVLWVQLPGRADGTTLYHRALQKGISITPGEIFSLGRRHRHFIRISCAHPWSARIERGITELARLMKPERG